MGLLILQALKWILWIILFLLLFFLILLFLALFVPVRYRAEGEYREGKLRLQGKISWFFSLAAFFLDYHEGMRFRLKFFGITFYDSKKPKKKKKIKKRPPKKRSKPENEGKRESLETDVSVSHQSAASLDETALPAGGEPEDETVLPAGDKPVGEITSPAGDKPAKETAFPVGAGSWEEQPFNTVSLEEDRGHTSGENEETALETASEDKENTLWEKIKSIFAKIKGIGNKLKTLIKRIQSIWKSCQDRKALFDHYCDLWKKEETQITWKRAKYRFGKIFKSISPKKFLLTGNIGFDNPALTGKMMAGLGIAYPWMGNHIQINPDFERPVMELKGFVKGRIRFGVLFYHMAALLLNRNCIAFIKMIFNELMGNKNNEETDSSMQEVADDRQ